MLLLAYVLVLLLRALTPNGCLISKQKCIEYGRQFPENCNVKPLPLIVGGMEANEKEFPHMALIGFGESDDENALEWDCGGSLISPKFVLGAAHCATSKENGPPKKVKFGTIKRHDNGKSLQVRKIIAVISHPDYSKPSKYNDIALYELDEPVEFTPYVQPACLICQAGRTPYFATAAGFGKTAFINDDGNENLLKVDLPVLNNSLCEPYYYKMRRTVLKKGIIDTMMCAGLIEGGKDTCQGDSGGPLQVYLDKPYCKHAIIGIISFGKFCGYAKSPAIYTNVNKFIPWIEDHVWGKENEI